MTLTVTEFKRRYANMAAQAIEGLQNCATEVGLAKQKLGNESVETLRSRLEEIENGIEQTGDAWHALSMLVESLE